MENTLVVSKIRDDRQKRKQLQVFVDNIYISPNLDVYLLIIYKFSRFEFYIHLYDKISKLYPKNKATIKENPKFKYHPKNTDSLVTGGQLPTKTYDRHMFDRFRYLSLMSSFVFLGPL